MEQDFGIKFKKFTNHVKKTIFSDVIQMTHASTY